MGDQRKSHGSGSSSHSGSSNQGSSSGRGSSQHSQSGTSRQQQGGGKDTRRTNESMDEGDNRSQGHKDSSK